jgi:voltage-gated potassium channel
MFFIASGEAVVEVSPRRQVVLKEGDFFGEMALLERRRHDHDVVAKTRCGVYVLDYQSLARLTGHHPEILRRIREVAAGRVAIRAARSERKLRAPSKRRPGEKQEV